MVILLSSPFFHMFAFFCPSEILQNSPRFIQINSNPIKIQVQVSKIHQTIHQTIHILFTHSSTTPSQTSQPVDHLQMAPAASAAELPLMRTFFCSPKPETRSWGPPWGPGAPWGCCSHGIIIFHHGYNTNVIVIVYQCYSDNNSGYNTNVIVMI